MTSWSRSWFPWRRFAAYCSTFFCGIKCNFKNTPWNQKERIFMTFVSPCSGICAEDAAAAGDIQDVRQSASPSWFHAEVVSADWWNQKIKAVDLCGRWRTTGSPWFASRALNLLRFITWSQIASNKIMEFLILRCADGSWEAALQLLRTLQGL